MTKVRTTLLDLHDLESLDLKTESRDGKRYYIDSKGAAYPSVTTVVGLKTKEQIKLWRERVGEETANKISTSAAKRGTSFHQNIDCFLYTSPSPRDS